MKNRMNKVRVLAGGLAAIITMSSMTSIAFAAEEPVTQVIEIVDTTEDFFIVDSEEIPVEETNDDVVEEVTKETEDVEVLENLENQENTEVIEDSESTEAPEARKLIEDETEEVMAEMHEAEEISENPVTEEAKAVEENPATEEAPAEPQKTDKEIVDELVATIDEIYPVKSTDTFKSEYEEHGVLTRRYTRDQKIVDRIYKTDGSYTEKVFEYKLVTSIKPSLLPGLLPTLEEEINSIRVYNPDGTWEETLYENGQQVSTTQYSADEMAQILRKENKAIQQLEDAKYIEENATLEEIVDFFSSLDTGKQVTYTNPNNKSADSNGKVAMDVEEEVPDIIRTAFGLALDKVVDKLPGKAIIGDSVKNFIKKAYHMDTKKEDTNKSILRRLEENQVKTSELIESSKRYQEVVSAINSNGKPLDEFTNNCYALAQNMDLLMNNAADGIINTSNMLVEIAASIGTPDSWIIGGTNIIKNFTNAASIFRAQNSNGSASDPNTRNIYQLFYDYNKESSMFSGEAIDKSATQLQSRIQNFAANCEVLLDVLNIHAQVANFTDEDVASLSDKNKALYEKIRDNKLTINNQKKLIANAFTGNRDSRTGEWNNGIIGAVKDYTSMSRTIFFEKTTDGFNEAKLSSKVYTKKAENFNGKSITKTAGLTREQIIKLQEHVNANGLTMEEYLEMVGFDLSSVKESGRTKAYMSTLDGTYSKGKTGRKSGTTRKTFTGIDMKAKNAKEQSYENYYKSWGGIWGNKEEKMDDSVVVILQMEQ